METIIQFLQGLNIDIGGSGAGLALCCGLSCVVIVVLGVGLQVFGVVFQGALGIFELGLEVFAGGPVAWCGCLVVIIGVIACGAIAIAFLNVMGTCGTPDQVNLCRLFGY